MGLLGNITSIFNKLMPKQKRRDVSRLNTLNKMYYKALKDGRETDAAVYRKQMKVLRKEMGYGEI